MSAFDVIDDAPVTRFHRKLLFACCGGPFLDGYILSLIGVAMVGIIKDIPATSSELGMVGAASLVGMFFGATLFGALTDKIGREKMYALDLAVLVVACGLTALVDSIWQLIVLRFIIGLAIGADYPIATSLLTEFTPKKRRGFMIGVSALAWALGAMTAFLVGFILVAATDEHPWRVMLASGAVLGVIVVLMRRGIPESPRWLASKGRFEEARSVVEQVYGREAASRIDLTPAEENKSSFWESLPLVVRDGNWKRTVMCSVLYLAQVTPLYAIYTFGGVILAATGVSGGGSEILGELLFAILFALGVLPALRLVETWGRRPMTLVPFALMALSLGGLAVWVDAPGWFVITAFLFYAVTSGGPQIMEWVYPNELFPTEVRATAVGIAVGVSRIGAAVGTYMVPIGIESIGVNATMAIAAGLTLFGFLVCFAWAPETKGRSLAETSASDGVSRKRPTATSLPE
ncbi:MFS transporter [Mycolicibacterium litorale]|uniref:MFS transporter n=1 Tax=Mycolicibacterium litorale TaxID=758802 RepID=UPI003CF635C1